MSRFGKETDPRRYDDKALNPTPTSSSNDDTVNDQPSSHVKKTDGNTAEHYDEKPNYGPNRTNTVAAKLTNPLDGLSEDDVLRDVDMFVDEKGLGEWREEFRRGALLARVFQQPEGYEKVSAILPQEL